MRLRKADERCEVCGSPPTSDSWGNLCFSCKCGKVVDERDSCRAMMRSMEREYREAIRSLLQDATEALGKPVPVKRFKPWEHLVKQEEINH